MLRRVGPKSAEIGPSIDLRTGVGVFASASIAAVRSPPTMFHDSISKNGPESPKNRNASWQSSLHTSLSLCSILVWSDRLAAFRFQSIIGFGSTSDRLITEMECT